MNFANRYRLLFVLLLASVLINEPAAAAQYSLSRGELFLKSADAVRTVDKSFVASSSQPRMTLVTGREARSLVNYSQLNAKQIEYVQDLLNNERSLAVLVGGIRGEGLLQTLDLVLLPLPKAGPPRPLEWKDVDFVAVGHAQGVVSSCPTVPHFRGVRGSCGVCVATSMPCCPGAPCHRGSSCDACPASAASELSGDPRSQDRSPIDEIDPRMLPLDLSSGR